MNYDFAVNAAAIWHAKHEAQYLGRDRNQMVNACTTYLCDLYSLTDTKARQIVMQTIADIEADDAEISGFIDIDRSSSRLVVLRDTATRSFHMITLSELFALVSARERAAA